MPKEEMSLEDLESQAADLNGKIEKLDHQIDKLVGERTGYKKELRASVSKITTIKLKNK